MSSPINHYDTNTDGSYLIDDGGQNYGSTVEREMKSFFIFWGGGGGGGSVWRWLCMAMAMYDKKLHVVVVARLSRGSETQERGGENLTV